MIDTPRSMQASVAALNSLPVAKLPSLLNRIVSKLHIHVGGLSILLFTYVFNNFLILARGC